ncbi:hypothetical protein GCK32_009637, partial [Trichostrongylus colubriformis]
MRAFPKLITISYQRVFKSEVSVNLHLLIDIAGIMKLRIVLLYIWMVNNVNNEEAPPPSPAPAPPPPPPPAPAPAATFGANEKDKRKPFNVDDPPDQFPGHLPTLVKSKGIPTFNQHDGTFTTIYPMTCGIRVTNPLQVEGTSARCMPDVNDVVLVQRDETVLIEDCLMVIICNPGENYELCVPDSIKVILPNSGKIIGNEGVQEYSGKMQLTKGQIVYTHDPGCLINFEGPHQLQH